MIRVIALVFTFLIKLRFPPKKGFVQVMKHRYGTPVLGQYRKLERLDYKLRKLNLDLDFLQTCKQHETIPKFLKCKVYNYHVSSTIFYKSFQFRLLDFEIKHKLRLIRRTETELEKIRDEFSQNVSHLDFTILHNRLLSSNETKSRAAKVIHQRKLLDLNINPFANVDLNKVIINLSKRKLTSDETTILSHGLSFALPNHKINFVDHFFSFEKLIQGLDSKTINQECGMNKTELSKIISSIAHTSFSEFNELKHTIPRLPECQLKALDNLRKDPSITITRPDKGRGAVILDKEDYVNEMEKILDDETKFTRISEQAFTVITRAEDRLQRFLRTLLADQIITQDTYKYLFPAGSSAGLLYGLPKTHKRGKLTFRPILSALGTFNYNVAKFLVPIIDPLTKNDCVVRNSYEFVKEVTELKLDNFVMASFDVVSLFTQIPLDETIDIICDTLFKKNKKVKKLSKPQFKQLLEFGVKDSPFLFNQKLYVQRDGVAMGSPLGPSFANCFMGHHEEKWLDDCPLDFRPLYYKRFVDDCFILFRNTEHIPKFQAYLNSKHENIKFTVEQEHEGTLPFLDVFLTRKGNTITTAIYRKPTFTGLGINYLSFIPNMFKINAIKTLMYRCFHLSSDWISTHIEIEFLIEFFKNNKFPLHIIYSNIRNFLNKTISPVTKTERDKSTLHYICFPYYGCLSFSIRKKLNKILTRCYPNTTFRYIFTNPKTISSLFKHKEALPLNLISNIVYEYKCSHCSMRYLGKTERNLTLRFAEHAGKSARTGRPVSHPLHSPVRSHTDTLSHLPLTIDDFRIIHRAKSGQDLSILESLYIQHLSPELNCDTSSYPLHTFK